MKANRMKAGRARRLAGMKADRARKLAGANAVRARANPKIT